MFIKKQQRLGRQIAIAIALCISDAIACSGDRAIAQLIPDKTLGSANSKVTSTGKTDSIQGGAKKGVNLFHSFLEFNVASGRSVLFINPSGIKNILTRVTGTNPSQIEGTLGVSKGTANLFLINPNGIIFGSKARLDVKGSFVATTANAIQLASGEIFSANPVTPVPSGLLKVNPNAFLFNQIAAKPIINRSTANSMGLQVPTGKSLLLVGGEIRLEGGRLRTSGGRVELAGVAGSGIVGLAVDGNNLQLSYPAQVQPADIALSDEARVNTTGKGGGDIQLSGRQITLTEGSQILSNTQGQALGGTVSVTASESVQLIGRSQDGKNASGIFVQTLGTGNAGNLTIVAKNLIVREGANVSVATKGAGQGGTVSITASDSVQLIGRSQDGKSASGLFATAEDIGDAGDLTVATKDLIVRDGAQISANTKNSGQGGTVSVTASNSVQLIGRSQDGKSASGLFATAEDIGDAGNLTVATKDLIVRDGAQISATTRNSGQGGTVSVTASDSVQLIGRSQDGNNGSGIFVQTLGNGNAGNLTIATKDLIVLEGANASVTTRGAGQGGILNVNASNSVQLIGRSADGENASGLFATAQDSGNAGNLTIVTKDFTVRDGAQVSVNTRSEGQGGTLTVNASNSVNLIGRSANGENASGLFATAQGTGSAGNLTIVTKDLIVQDGATASVNNRGKGQGGTLNVNATNSVQLIGRSADGLRSSGLIATADNEATGNGGKLAIATGKLIIRDGARIRTDTFGQGNGGEILIQASDSVNISGFGLNGLPSGLFTGTGGTGEGGTIIVNTPVFRLVDGAVVNALTTDQGDGGTITLNVNTLEALNGGQIVTTTRSSGRAGNIILNVADSILLSGSDPTFANRQAQSISQISINESAASGLFASTSQNSTGLGGNLKISTGQLIVRDGAEVTASSLGSGNAGDVNIEADSIFLDNQGKLRAATASGEGGNIRLQVRDLLLMRRQSLISATADKNGNGGNIEINAPFIVAFPGEDSDIIANANRGRGGNINIATNGIFGLDYRQKLTSFSDINASSAFGVNGTVQIFTLGIDPSRGLTTLPAELVDASGLIAQTCPASGGQVASSFTVTGNGGLPDNPSETRSSSAVWTDWRNTPKASSHSSKDVAIQSTNLTKEQLVEAQGWLENDKGEVVLTASVPDSAHRSRLTTAKCHVP